MKYALAVGLKHIFLFLGDSVRNKVCFEVKL